MNRRALPILAAALFAATIAAFAGWRMFYGIDFADEGFYVAMPYTFALGNQPFVNELALQQTAALLVTPFTRAYVALRGSEGIVLFFRELFLLLALLTAAAIFRLARAVADVPAALLVAVLPFIVVPGIASISYNSLGMNLLCAGACLAAHGVLRESRLSLLLAGPSLVLASFAYPTLVVPATLCVVAGAMWLALRHHGAAWRALVYGWLATVVMLFAWVASFGWENVATSLLYMLRHAMHGGDSGKLATLWKAFLSSAPYPRAVLVALAVTVVATFFLGRRAWMGIALTAGLLAAFRHEGDWRVISLVVLYGTLFLLPGAWWVGRGGNGTNGKNGTNEIHQPPRSQFPPISTIVLLPGLIAAGITAWTSSNGFPNAGIGAYTAFAAVLILVLAVPSRHGGAEIALAVACVLAMIAVFTFRYVYREEELSRLTARIDSGPYAGLYTTPARRDFVAKLAADVARHGAGKKVLFYDTFPAGYLFVDTPPPIETTWIPYAQDFPAFDRAWYISYYHRPENRPDAVFEILSVPTIDGGLRYQTSLPSDPMHHGFWRSGYQVVEANPFYAIHRRCDPCVTDVVEAENLIPADARLWRRFTGRYSHDAAASTTRRGAVLHSTIPRFRPGPYRVDFSLYRNLRRTHEVRIALGDDERRIVVGRHAPFRISRAIGAVFADVQTPEFSLEVDSSGKGAILLDEIAFSRAPSVDLLAGDCSYCEIGPLQRRPVTFEPESVVTLDRESPEERKRVRTDWIRIRHPRYSGGAAVMTSSTEAAIRGRAARLRPGDYRATVHVIHRAAGYAAALRVTVGGVTRILRTDPSLPPGTHPVTAMFPGVRGEEVIVTAVDPGKPSLMIDSLVMHPATSAR
ncbi:MAG TPA: hypothetical protein VEK57_17490 [Thermoanaerobaculia bacterium]|nr:hypothetical protein [Thermoanaerobaculia bacterium]